MAVLTKKNSELSRQNLASQHLPIRAFLLKCREIDQFTIAPAECGLKTLEESLKTTKI